MSGFGGFNPHNQQHIFGQGGGQPSHQQHSNPPPQGPFGNVVSSSGFGMTNAASASASGAAPPVTNPFGFASPVAATTFATAAPATPSVMTFGTSSNFGGGTMSFGSAMTTPATRTTTATTPPPFATAPTVGNTFHGGFGNVHTTTNVSSPFIGTTTTTSNAPIIAFGTSQNLAPAAAGRVFSAPSAASSSFATAATPPWQRNNNNINTPSGNTSSVGTLTTTAAVPPFGQTTTSGPLGGNPGNMTNVTSSTNPFSVPSNPFLGTSTTTTAGGGGGVAPPPPPPPSAPMSFGMSSNLMVDTDMGGNERNRKNYATSTNSNNPFAPPATASRLNPFATSSATTGTTAAAAATTTYSHHAVPWGPPSRHNLRGQEDASFPTPAATRNQTRDTPHPKKSKGFPDTTNNNNYTPFPPPVSASESRPDMTWPPPVQSKGNHNQHRGGAGDGSNQADKSSRPSRADRDAQMLQQPPQQPLEQDLHSNIEKMKKKLARLKSKKESAKGDSPTPAPPPSQPVSTRTKLNAAATSFVPSTTRTTTTITMQSDESTDATAPSNEVGASQSLKERNKARFDSSTGSNNHALVAHLPTDLQAMAGQAVDYSALRSTGDSNNHNNATSSSNRADLDQATSLKGTCPYMCPDEELLRRQAENDIQLLELVRPKELHPEGWTLRDTAIKRFRRSAADYKLDVPEWIRPPDVLERVCGYLEEWIMERDRQGPDPRFKGTVPQSLDVYQFIWDRTRMIRKDFTLQNYVGTGGNCDARAVRCHERIARWHAMCEHQLSHISDFVVMQSQQNIQELGQTLKTLNHFYDDALKRSRVEVPDENGNETRTDLTNYTHGCQSSIVQGNNPVDYDGGEMVNAPPSGSRLVGEEGVHQYHHGTAEPEMRGLYILLTIDNDGGMEVMRYAAHLSRERPEIFKSRPVQLALQIYLAKRNLDYARFFRILRSSSTPYLFSCIMFKYVDHMRKAAFEMLSRTIADVYPLKDLVRALCYEDEEEAASACQHFGITVKNVKVKSSTSGERMENLICWRETPMQEPRDPDKGNILPLRPKKMARTIERKLNGATRLAVCRGDVSGKGAFLRGDETQISPRDLAFEDLARRQAAALKAMNDEERAKADQLRRLGEQKKHEARLLEEVRATAEAEEERLRKIEDEKRLAHEREITRKKVEEADRLRKQEEERREQERQKEEEARLKRLEEERIRRENEAAEQERIRRLEEQRREEEHRKAEEERRRREAEQERIRKEQEAHQLELQRIQDAKRKAQEEEERRLTLEWDAKIAHASKLIAFRRWKQMMPRCVEMYEVSRKSLSRMMETKLSHSLVQRIVRDAAAIPREPQISLASNVKGLRSIVDKLLLKDEPFQLELDCLRNIARAQQRARQDSSSHVYLIKIAVIFPESDDSHYSKLCSLLHAFVSNRLAIGKPIKIFTPQGEVRVTFVDGNIPQKRYTCDGVLIVVPSSDDGIPPDGLKGVSQKFGSVPRAAVLLSQTIDSNKECSEIYHTLKGGVDDLPVMCNTELSEESINNALFSSVESILHKVTEQPLDFIECIPVDRLAILCLNKSIWLDSILDSRDGLSETAKDTLAVLVDQLNSFGETGKDEWHWPSSEFLLNGSYVPDYFGPGVHLPFDWTASLLRENVDKPLREMAQWLNGPFPTVVENLLALAPDEVTLECQELYEKRMFRRCLQCALVWRHENKEPWQTVRSIYLPHSLISQVIERTVDAVNGSQTPSLGQLDATVYMTDTPANYTVEDEQQLTSIKTPPSSPAKEIDGTPQGSTMKSQSQPKPAPVQLDYHAEISLSTSLKKSRDFTRRLQAMAAGNFVPRVMVGKRPLAVLLRGVPPPVDPPAVRQTKRRVIVEDII